MSYLFFLITGVLWGFLCGYCDSRGILRDHRSMMQLVCGLIGYGVTALCFWGVPASGNWFIHLLLVVTVGQIAHGFFRTRLTPGPQGGSKS